ncbi:MAG TPA: hemerythrin domain-containing protein [Polyangiaceae bacterium]|jgi:hemerythrin-like domain-containing protein|nr:hemerythrin domain-containing protein [Polyangiaceae bacterium]
MDSHTRLITPVPALQSLGRDHQVLALLADALDAYAGALASGAPLLPGDFTLLVQAWRSFGDQRHYEKEEQIVTPLLVRSGLDYDLPVLIEERRARQQLRYLIAVLEHAAHRELQWSGFERSGINACARTLTEVHRRSSSEQERELFPEIVTLAPDMLGALNQQLLRFDAADDARRQADPARDVRALLARYGVERAGATAAGERRSASATGS